MTLPTRDRVRELEAELHSLAERLPDPVTAAERGEAHMLGALLGGRSATLFRGLLHAHSSPTVFSAFIELRPLVELAILMKWISLEPGLNGELWFAQSEEADLRTIRQVERHLGPIRMQDPEADARGLAAKEQVKAEAVEHALAAARNYGNRIAPTLEGMVVEIEGADPDHRIAMRQAYEIAYRGVSPIAHSEAASFKESVRDEGDGRFTYLGDRAPYGPETARMLGVTMFAYCLEVADQLLKLGIGVAARRVRDEVANRPPTIGN